MKYDLFGDFVEFKNTKQGKKVDNPDQDIIISFRKILDKKHNYQSVRITLNQGMVKSLKDNKIFTFKILYQENTNNILIRFDNSSNAFSIINKKIRPDQTHDFYNKYITAVMLDVMKEKNAKSLIYKGKYYEDKLAYLFKLSEIKKGE